MAISSATSMGNRFQVGATLFWQTPAPEVGEVFTTVSGRYRVTSFEPDPPSDGFLVHVEVEEAFLTDNRPGLL